MWVLYRNNRIEKMFRKKEAFSLDGISYPDQVFDPKCWTNQERANIGIYAYRDARKPLDERFYRVNGETETLYSDQFEVVKEYTMTPRELEDITNENGTVTKGLKTKFIEEYNMYCHNTLQTTDWYIVREMEIGTEVPEEIAVYRSNVRDAVNTLQTNIANVETVEELQKLIRSFNWPEKQ